MSTNLLNLIKSKSFRETPEWWQVFVHRLMLIGGRTMPSAIYSDVDFLTGFLSGLILASLIDVRQAGYLIELVHEAEKHAINKIKEAKKWAH